MSGDGDRTDESLETRLTETAEMIETASSAADLEVVADRLDALETELADAALDEQDDEDLEAELAELEDRLADAREPSSATILERLEEAVESITGTEFTDRGRESVLEATEAAVDRIASTVGAELDADGSPEQRLRRATDAIEAAELDPVADADHLDQLVDAADELTDRIEAAEAFADLSVREQLRRQGFYDVLSPERRRDFPPEWNAVKIYGARGEAEPLLTALDALDSAFMQENILEAIERSAPPAAFEGVHELASRRDEQAVRVLGRIGDERACETLHEFLGGARSLELTTLRALGAIGSDESTEPIAGRLRADDPAVRSAAARALGAIGDTRAIAPLKRLLEEDDASRVRASAAWALRQIGTERALTIAAEYADERSYLLEREAGRAQAALAETERS